MHGLTRLRKQAELSQETVAAALKIDRSAVSKWETAAASPSTKNISRLASLYGCTIDDVFDAIFEQEEIRSNTKEAAQ